MSEPVPAGDAKGRIFDARRERYGRTFDELQPGDIYRHWPGKTITEADDHLFCLLTMATSPLHVDAAHAEREMKDGKNMVVGTLVYSLLVGMSLADVTGQAVAALGVDELRHVAPLFHGDTLYGETTIVAKRRSESREGIGIVTAETRGFNQHGLLVCRFRRAVMLGLGATPAGPGSGA
ncbi:MAG: MaoC family dehydratase [Gaiellaceae bacterium]